MKKTDLKQLTDPQLKSLRKSIDALLVERRREERSKERLLAKIRKLAQSQGLSLEDVLAAKAPAGRRPRKKAAKKKTTHAGAKRGTRAKARYRNPANRRETWTGRGRKPAWVLAHLDQGGALDDLAVK